MGHKVHPYGYRLGYTRTWTAKWYADKEYTTLLREDIAIRQLLDRRLANASVSAVEIERGINHVTVTIHTAKPGIVIGKGGANVEILRQQGPLEERQLRLLRTHADRAARLLRALDRDESVAQAVQFHHENVDGSGYHGRRGNEIPLAARIVAVAEAYDAMTMSRIREPLRRDEAIAVLEEQKGTRFDTACVDALVASVRSRPRSVPISPLG